MKPLNPSFQRPWKASYKDSLYAIYFVTITTARVTACTATSAGIGSRLAVRAASHALSAAAAVLVALMLVASVATIPAMCTPDVTVFSCEMTSVSLLLLHAETVG